MEQPEAHDQKPADALLRDTLLALLVEFHEHSCSRIPDLKTSLVDLTNYNDTPVAGQFNPELPVPPSTPAALVPFVRRVKEQYASEMDKICSMCEEHCAKWVQTLRLHAQEGRPVTVAEVQIHVNSIQRKFLGVRVWLKRVYTEWMRKMVEEHAGRSSAAEAAGWKDPSAASPLSTQRSIQGGNTPRLGSSTPVLGNSLPVLENTPRGMSARGLGPGGGMGGGSGHTTARTPTRTPREGPGGQPFYASASEALAHQGGPAGPPPGLADLPLYDHFDWSTEESSLYYEPGEVPGGDLSARY